MNLCTFFLKFMSNHGVICLDVGVPVHYFDMYGFYIFVLFINLNYLSCVFMNIFIC